MSRRDLDAYYTPRWCFERLREAVYLPKGDWLEPAYGDGALVRAAGRDDVTWDALDLEPRGPLDLRVQFALQADYLTWTPEKRYRVILTNPPFNLAEQFVRKALTEADYVVMLLRLNFLGATRRAELLREHPPDVYVLPNRPSFTGTGERDAQEYAWCVWNQEAPPHTRTHGTFRVLAVTSPAERRLG